jgi:hypothetical protein
MKKPLLKTLAVLFAAYVIAGIVAWIAIPAGYYTTSPEADKREYCPDEGRSHPLSGLECNQTQNARFNAYTTWPQWVFDRKEGVGHYYPVDIAVAALLLTVTLIRLKKVKKS